jgi:RNA polymerase sigma-70 factor (ECF subfamily)
LPRYREQGQLAAWLYRTATNLVRSDQRRQAAHRVFARALAHAARAASTSHPSHEAQLVAAERQRAIAAALAELPLRWRAPLVLHEIEELSYEEIAALLGCRLGTIKSRISRARERLKVALKSHVGDLDGGGSDDR